MKGILLLHPQDKDSPPSTDEQFQLVMNEIKAIAKAKLASEPNSISIQPTALVNEAYIRLKKAQPLQWNDTNHFVALAARAMQWILIDHARHKRNQKNGGEWTRVEIHDAENGKTVIPDFRDLHDALGELEKVDQRAFTIIQLYFFGGRTHQEVADHLEISLSQVKREWKYAQAWLQDRLRSAQP